MNSVCVLMSTYNGEEYLEEQIDSIINQKNVSLALIVRDDGSTDKTISILNKYKQDGKLAWYKGKNVGSAKSFWDLLVNSPNADYYAFADQDDYWLDTKISRAVDLLGQNDSNRALLYFSSKTITDKNLKTTGENDEPVRGVSLEYSLLRGFASGCTMVFNKQLRDTLVRYEPKVMTMHDSWILKVAGAVGEIVYDEKPSMLYRQHGNNTVGNLTKRKNIQRHIENITMYKGDTMRGEMARQLLEYYGNYMSEEDKYYASLMSNARNSVFVRLRMFISRYYKTQIPHEIIFFKLFFLLGWV